MEEGTLRSTLESKGLQKSGGGRRGTRTFVEQHHDLLEGLHEVDVVVAVLLDLQQQAELGETLGGEGLQQEAVLLRGRRSMSEKSTAPSAPPVSHN